MRSLHKDNIKITSLIAGGLLVGGGLVVKGGYVSYKVFENAKEMKDLDKKMSEKFEMIAKEMKDLERFIVSNIFNIQTGMISVLASSNNLRHDEIKDAFRLEKQKDVTVKSNGDNQ